MGTAKVTRGSEQFLLTENQSTYIPLGVVHRLENPGVLPLEIIEVQSGAYLGEDDIVRFEDNYHRDGLQPDKLPDGKRDQSLKHVVVMPAAEHAMVDSSPALAA